MDHGTVDAPHPTREEWEKRQAYMSLGMRRLINSYIDDLNAKHAAELAAEEAKAKLLRDRLAGFELALRAVLSECPELAQFREASPKEITTPFTERHCSWYAFYNLERVGGWRLMIEIPFHCGSDLGWQPDRVRFTAMMPTHQSEANTLAKAMWLVSQYVSTPF